MAEYIEREAAIAAAFSATSLGNSAFRDVYDTVNRLRLIPAADVRKVVRGKWQCWTQEKPPCKWYSCDYCGFHSLEKHNYCPCCGSKMNLEENK